MYNQKHKGVSPGEQNEGNSLDTEMCFTEPQKKRKKYDRTYYEHNQEKKKAYQHKYYEHNQEKRKAYQHKYRIQQKSEHNKRCTHMGAARNRFFEDNTISEHSIGKMEYECGKCSALMFKDEQHKLMHKGSNSLCYSLCCSYGSVKVPPISEPPDLLRRLLTNCSPLSRHFIQNIRAYNSAFAFASMTLTGQEYVFQGRGPYCFRINGQVYHTISQLLPDPGCAHKFSQLYLYDSAAELNARLQVFDNLDQTIIKELQDMISSVNPYAALYHSIRDFLHCNPMADVTLVLNTSSKEIDNRRYNVPTGTDIAMVIPVENENKPLNKHIVIYKNREHNPTKSELITMDDKNPMYDPLLYVLMFPYGDKGWEIKSNCSQLEYYAYRLMVHAGSTFNVLHRMGRLFQQYIVDMYSKVEAARLSYIRFHQNKLRTELYQGLADAVQGYDGKVDGSQIGKKVILPSSFTGSARYQHQLYQDAMAIVRRYGKPDLFITFTCNPQWPEITQSLLQNQVPADRPDIVTQGF